MKLLDGNITHLNAKLSSRTKMIFHPDNLPMDKGPQGSPVLGGRDLTRHLVNHSDMFGGRLR